MHWGYCWRLIVTALVLITHLHLASAFPLSTKAPAPVLDLSSTPDEQALISWVRFRGGFVNVKIDKECPKADCMRGLIALEDIMPAGLILRLPQLALIRLSDLDHVGFAAEYARDLMYRMQVNNTFNQTYASYLITLPQSHELFPPELWNQSHVEMLQTPNLEILAGYSVRSTEQIYNGTYPEHTYDPMSVLLGSKANDTCLNDFKYLSAVLGSRYFGMPGTIEEDKKNNKTKEEKVRYVLAPVMDQANHADGVEGDRLNAYQTVFNNSLILRALRPIKKGEAIRFNYQPGVVHRPDMSLLVYGFIQKRKSKPVLCSVDLPTFNINEQFAPTPESDEQYYGPKGKYNTEEELKRLKRLLEAAPTTLKQDEALLKNKRLDWRQKLLVEFRIERKKALSNAIEVVKKELKRRKRRKEEL